jgi:hypothetical protein
MHRCLGFLELSSSSGLEVQKTGENIDQSGFLPHPLYDDSSSGLKIAVLFCQECGSAISRAYTLARQQHLLGFRKVQCSLNRIGRRRSSNSQLNTRVAHGVAVYSVRKLNPSPSHPRRGWSSQCEFFGPRIDPNPHVEKA